MKAAGIVAEYNPFHNGHYYHLKKTLSLSDAKVIVCVMSGDFVQRGEVALYDKFARTQMALKAGADLVVMLPFAYSAQSAELFAYGAVNILSQLSCDYISFGCETDNLKQLKKAAQILSFENKNYKEALFNNLSQGRSYAKSRQLALNEIDPDISYLLNSPNNILAIEYIKQIILNNYDIMPLPIKRLGSEHNSVNSHKHFASASLIRELIKSSDDNFITFIPSFVYDILRTGPQNDIENYKNIIYQNLILSSSESLKSYPDISHSLANKMLNTFKSFKSISDFVDDVSDKHHTKTRILRSLCHIMVGFDMPYHELKSRAVPYIRILGFNENGRNYLSKIKHQTNLVSNTYDYYKNCRGFDRDIFNYDLRAGDIYNLGTGGQKGLDYQTMPIYFKH